MDNSDKSTLKIAGNNSKIKNLATWLKSEGLVKYKNQVKCLDLPAGYTCPCANLCYAYSDRITGKLTKGDSCIFTCYATKAESQYPSVRKARWFNYELLLNCTSDTEILNLLQLSLPKNLKYLRLHSSGDIFSKKYFKALCQLAKNNPELVIFGYTKILNYVTADKPDNFKLVYSYGGKMDNKHDSTIPTCYVDSNVESARCDVVCQGKDADYQDFIKIMKQKSFSIIVH